ncbi:hypothetical protein [Streptomyces sp. NPDC056165]
MKKITEAQERTATKKSTSKMTAAGKNPAGNTAAAKAAQPTQR